MRIRFDSNDDLPINKILSIPVLSIVVKSGFQNAFQQILPTNSYTWMWVWIIKNIHSIFVFFLETFYETKSQYSISFSYVDNLILFIMLRTFMRQNLSIQLFFCIMS